MLIVVLSALLALAAGSGRLLSRLLFAREQRSAFVALVAGVSALHLLTLTGLPLGVVLGIVLLLAVAELVIVVVAERDRLRIDRRRAAIMAVVLAVCLPLWTFFLVRPLWAYDARNTWFFHGRIIFSSGHFPMGEWAKLFCLPANKFSVCAHPDYPKFIGIVSASVAYLLGYWNEYLPKLAIVVVHVIELVGLVELGWWPLALGLTGVMTVVPLYRYHFDSASLDIHVGALTLVALLALFRLLEARAPERERTSPTSPSSAGAQFGVFALAALALAAQLKYEGRAIALVLITSALLLRAVRLADLWRWRSALALFLPAVVWLVQVRLLHLPTYFESRGLVAVVRERLHAEYATLIIPYLLQQTPMVSGAVLFVGAAGVALWLRRRTVLARLPRDPRLRLALLTALAYTLLLSLVYLLSPYPKVYDHLHSSVDRVTLTSQAALIAAAVAAFTLGTAPPPAVAPGDGRPSEANTSRVDCSRPGSNPG